MFFMCLRLHVWMKSARCPEFRFWPRKRHPFYTRFACLVERNSHLSSARELARQCEYEPGCQWLCGLQAISHRTLSGFRSDHKAALADLFVQVLGMMSAEGLITLERVTLDGTKIKANAGGNSWRRTWN
jgi:transposase